MTSKVYPFASGSEYTASFAINTSVAISASRADSAQTSSFAGTVLFPESGSAAEVDICIITYEQYLQILSGSGDILEFCVSEE